MRVEKIQKLGKVIWEISLCMQENSGGNNNRLACLLNNHLMSLNFPELSKKVGKRREEKYFFLVVSYFKFQPSHLKERGDR